MSVSAYSKLHHLPLETYARIMSIPGWAFNQVTHPDRVKRGICPEVTLQSGYFGDPNRIVGRDEIAQGIATAMDKIARFLGYWPTRKWYCNDEHDWPHPKIGVHTQLPVIGASWGYIVGGGVEAFELLVDNAFVLYSDEDGDNVMETATVIAEIPYLIHDKCELVVVPHGYDPEKYAIRPLGVVLTPTGCGLYTTSNLLCIYPEGIGVYAPSSSSMYLGDFCLATFTGWTWQFVVPQKWLTIDELKMSEPLNFLSGQYTESIYPGIYGYDVIDVPGPYDTEYGDGVDIYRRYNDPSRQAQIVWLPNFNADFCSNNGNACEEACQSGCITVRRSRISEVTVSPSVYHTDTCTFSRQAFYNPGFIPDKVRLWYRAGYDDDNCEDCDQFGAQVAEAIVRLANCYMAEAPCGCSITKERWDKDREEMSIDTVDIELAQSAFGTTMRGAVFAHAVFKTLPPLGMGR